MANLIGPLLGGLLTVAFGWRADWWALVPLALAPRPGGSSRHVPSIVHEVGEEGRASVLNRTVAAAALVAGLTFAVMIGTFYLAEQYLQKAVGYSALGASAVLVVVALLVGAAAPLAGGLVDARGERLPTILGFLGAGVGMAILAIPGVSLHGIGTAFALIPIGLGLGMLFVPVSRAALNATPDSSHGRTSAVLSVARLGGAALGAGLAGSRCPPARPPRPCTRRSRLEPAPACCWDCRWRQSVRREARRPAAWHDRRRPWALPIHTCCRTSIRSAAASTTVATWRSVVATRSISPASSVRRPSSSPRMICAPVPAPTRWPGRAQPGQSTCCSLPRRSRARPFTGSWPRRGWPAMSPPAASSRWRWRRL